MPESADTLEFIRNSFRSVWSIELFLLLRSDETRAWAHAELLELLRASDVIVHQGIAGLVAGGLAVIEEDGAARYAPVTGEIGRLADAAAELYAKRPDHVRRQIIAGANNQLSAFADAFRLRRD